MAAPSKNTKKNGMSNPAAMVVASPAGQSAIKKAADTQTEVIKKGASVVRFAFEATIVIAVLAGAYYLYSRRFKKLSEVSSYPDANITISQAETIARAIYGTDGTFTNDFNTVKQVFAGLNYNAIVRVYNAFGKKETYLGFGKDLTLFEWLATKYSRSQMIELRLLAQGFF